MKKKYLAIIASVFIFSCGSDAENSKSKELENKQVEEFTVVKEVTPVEEITVKDLVEEEAVVGEKEITEELVTSEIEHINKETPKETVVEEIETLVKEEVPVVVEVTRANHTAWNDITKKNVTAAGKVNYKAMKADLSKIETYLAHLKNTPPKNDWSKNEKLAYWLNLYNASTVYLITTNYPVSSITKINGGKPWDKKFVKSGDKIYTLNDIENTIVRPTFKDPRVHAALNCAAKSCPKMMNGAFSPKSINAQLDKQVKAWISDAGRNKISADKVEISQIFDWYKADFKGNVIAFLNKYGAVTVNESAKVSYLEYNWALNE